MPLPETVDDHARGERTAGDPVGQLPPATPSVGRHRLPTEDVEPAPGHRGARLLRIAPLMEGHIVGLPLDDGVGHRERRLRRDIRERLRLELPQGDQPRSVVGARDRGERERHAVERGRMAVGHGAADEIPAVGRADPGDGDRTILRGVDVEGVAREIGPGLDRTRGRVGKRARQLTAHPADKLWLPFDSLLPLRQKRRPLGGPRLEEAPRRARVVDKWIGR